VSIFWTVAFFLPFDFADFLGAGGFTLSKPDTACSSVSGWNETGLDVLAKINLLVPRQLTFA
jgi:hypothetical protein